MTGRAGSASPHQKAKRNTTSTLGEWIRPPDSQRRKRGTSPSGRKHPDRSDIPSFPFFPSIRTFKSSEEYARDQFYLEQQRQLLKSILERPRETYDSKSQTHTINYDTPNAHKIKNHKKKYTYTAASRHQTHQIFEWNRITPSPLLTKNIRPRSQRT